MQNKQDVKAPAYQIRRSISAESARKLSTTTNTAPQVGFKTPRWFLRMLPKIDVPTGIFRVNRVKVSVDIGTKLLLAVPLSPHELKKIDLFQHTSLETLQRLSALFKTKQYEKGSVIIQHGGADQTFYIIISGQCEVTTPGRFGTKQILGIIAEGDFFGETSLIEKVSRTATVTALTDTEVLYLDQSDAAEILSDSSTKSKILDALKLRKKQNREFLETGERAIPLVSCLNGEPAIEQSYIEYSEDPLEYDLSTIETIIGIHTRISDIYSQPYDQIEQQLRIAIEAIEEQEEWEILNHPTFGLLNLTDNKGRIISTRSGSPTPDDLDELLSVVWKNPSAFFCHPKTIAAFSRECTRRGVPPATINLFGTNFITWRGVPIIPCDKIGLNQKGGESILTDVLLVRFGEANQGVIGLHKAAIGSKNTPSLAVKYMNTDDHSIARYLLSKYFGIAALVPDAVGILTNVEVGRYYDYPL